MEVDEGEVSEIVGDTALTNKDLEAKLRAQEMEIMRWKLLALENENKLLKGKKKGRSSGTSDDETKTIRALTQKDRIQDARLALEDFVGGGNPASVERFLKTLEDYFRTALSTDEEKIATFNRRMKGKADIWWTYYRDSILPTVQATYPGRTFPQVEIAFRKQFLPPHYTTELVGKWTERS